MTVRYVRATVPGAAPVTVALDVTTPTTGWPSKEDTGPAAGTTFTTYSGPADVAPGTYRKVRFPAAVRLNRAGPYVLEDCDFAGGWTLIQLCAVQATRCRFSGGFSLSSVQGATITRCQVSGRTGGDLTHITSDAGRQCRNITFRECWIGDAVLSANDHLDGLQVRGVAGLVLDRCSIDVGSWQETPNGGKNAAVFTETANGGNSNVTISGCYLNGGGYILRAGNGGHTGLSLVGNRFGPDGRWGAALLDNVTPAEAVDNLYLANRAQASGLPVIP